MPQYLMAGISLDAYGGAPGPPATTTYTAVDAEDIIIDITALNLQGEDEVWLLCDFETDTAGDVALMFPSFDGGVTYNSGGANIHVQWRASKGDVVSEDAKLSSDNFELSLSNLMWNIGNLTDERCRTLCVFYDLANTARSSRMKTELGGFQWDDNLSDALFMLNGECTNTSLITHLKMQLNLGLVTGKIHLNVRRPSTGWVGKSPITYLETATWLNQPNDEPEWNLTNWGLTEDDILIADYEIHPLTDEKYMAFRHAEDTSPFTFGVANSSDFRESLYEHGSLFADEGNTTTVWPLSSVLGPHEPTNTAGLMIDGRAFFFDLTKATRTSMVAHSTYFEADADNLVQAIMRTFQVNAVPITALAMWGNGNHDGEIQFFKYGPVT